MPAASDSRFFCPSSVRSARAFCLRLDRRVEVAGLGLRGGERIENDGFFQLVNSQARLASWTAFLPSRTLASGQAAMSIALALYDLGSPDWSRIASPN